jgi:hypothetical protein
MKPEVLRFVGGPLNGLSVVVGNGVEIIDAKALLKAIQPLSTAEIRGEPKDGLAQRIVVLSTKGNIVYVRSGEREMKYQESSG